MAQEGITEAQRGIIHAALHCASKRILRTCKVHRKDDKAIRLQTEHMIAKHFKRWDWSTQLGCIRMLAMDA